MSLDLFTAYDMSFETDKKTLHTLVQQALPAVASSTISPVLTNFLISASKSSLQIISSDSITTILTSLNHSINIGDSGKALIPASRLISILKELRDEDRVVIGVKDSTALIATDDTKWNLPLHRLSSYPALNLTAEMHKFSKDLLYSALKRVKFAVSMDPSRPNLAVVSGLDNKITASDSYRLQQVIMSDNLPFPILIPGNKISLLMKFMEQTPNSTVSLGLNDKNLIVVIGTCLVSLPKLSLKFPDVDKAILKPALENDMELELDREDLISAIKKVRSAADIDSGSITITINSSNAEIKAKDKSGNYSSSVMPVLWGGTLRSFVVSHKYLIEMLRSHTSKRCSILLGPDTKLRKLPLLVRDIESGLVSVLSQSVDF